MSEPVFKYFKGKVMQQQDQGTPIPIDVHRLGGIKR